MKYNNEMSIKFLSLNENNSFARLAVASFCSSVLNNVEDLTDIKTAVSEGVTNCVVHAYPHELGYITINCFISDSDITIEIIDDGIGIENVDEAIKPFFTSKPEMERSGLGFTVMEGFVDKMEVISSKDKGTKVVLVKKYLS